MQSIAPDFDTFGSANVLCVDSPTVWPVNWLKWQYWLTEQRCQRALPRPDWSCGAERGQQALPPLKTPRDSDHVRRYDYAALHQVTGASRPLQGRRTSLPIIEVILNTRDQGNHSLTHLVHL